MKMKTVYQTQKIITWAEKTKEKKILQPFLANSKRGFLLNFTLVVLLLILCIVAFFFAYLPNTTHYGETITVPDAKGLSVADAQQMFSEKDFRSEVIDSVFSNEFLPNVVISQSPKPNQLAKVNRTVYLVVNAFQAPEAALPNVIGSFLPNAKQMLQSFGFRLGTVKYISNPNANQVLFVSVGGQQIGASELAEGFLVPKSQPVDLEVADGIGNIEVNVPSVIGLPLDEAEVYLLGSNLRIGNLRWIASNKPYGTVLNQNPASSGKIKLNESVDLWVAK